MLRELIERAEFDQRDALAPGPAPDFTLPARDGGSVQPSSLKGQVVMINLWATWCGPCRQEMPLLEQLQAKYEPLGFTLLGVNVEADSAAATAWLKSVPVSFPILFDTRNAVAEQFGVMGMPSSVFVGREGRVRHVHRGYKPGDEAQYADTIMAADRNPVSTSYLNHVFEAREGARGALGSHGGGGGCN